MSILVTGGAGFIGSHLVDNLVGAGEQVVVLDDLSTGSRRNLSTHAGSGQLQFVRGSVLDQETVGELVARSSLVFHLAAAVGVNQIVGSPVRSIVTNVLGTHNVLDACAQREVPVLLTSTSEVYGKSVRPEFCEDDDLVLGPTSRSRWSYAASKAVDEWLALAYAHERGLRVHIVRLFNTVGPRQTGRYGMVLPRFVGQALAGEPVTVFGDGKQSRAFVHVRDIVPALVAFAGCADLGGEIVNLGSTEEIRILDLAQRVISVTGSTSRIIHVPYDDAYERGFEDMRRRRPSIAKAGKLLGFAPSTELDEIIRDVAASLAAGGQP